MEYEDTVKFIERDRRERNLICFLVLLLVFVLIVRTTCNSEKITDEEIIISETKENDKQSDISQQFIMQQTLQMMNRQQQILYK